MKLIRKKSIFLALVALIVFTLVASTGNPRYLQSQDRQPMKNCWIAGSAVKPEHLVGFCTNLTKLNISSLTANLNLSAKERFLAAIQSKLPIVPPAGNYEYILLRAYGAAFINPNPEIKLPPKIVFADDKEVKAFQATLTMGKVNNTNDCYLQKAAANAFNRAKAQVAIALKSGYGASDCTRDFATNLRFWRKYAHNKTLEKIKEGKETKILGIVAPPGASQHLWGLAIDLQVTNAKQKQALYQNGWFQTVEDDIPHWTYLGEPLDKLAELGLQNKVVRGASYWVTPL